MEIIPKKIRNHFYWCVKHSEGDPEEFKESFLGMIDHWDEQFEHYMSQETKEAFQKWAENQLKDLEKIVNGHLTDLEEGFHSFNRRYWRKGIPYGYQNYMARRALAALDWCEQAKNEENSIQTSNFQKRIASTFHDFMMSRKKRTKNWLY